MYRNSKSVISTTFFRFGILRKLIRVMKLTTVLCIVALMQVNANTYSQKISLNVKNASLENVLALISSQSSYNFIYNSTMLKEADPVTIKVKDKSLSTVLDLCFKSQPLTYVINNKTIVIKKREPVKGSSQNTSGFLAVMQQVPITGRVVDADGVPVAHASVIVKGTALGTSSDANGAFSLTVADRNVILVISYIGFKQQEIAVGSKDHIIITLQREEASLQEEVVVVGYGTQKKINLTGAVSSVNMDDVVQSRPVMNTTAALAGMMPGVLVTAGSNQPSSNAASILIRGIGTLNNASPLIIIDGVNSNISNVNPNDIASISVLKDAASAAIYGSRAANGVVLITTKQGSSRAIKLNYNGYLSVESKGKTFEPVSNYADYMELINEGRRNSNMSRYFSDNMINVWRENEGKDDLKYPNTNWIDEVFKPATAQSHNLSISGGSDKINFYTSISYLNNPGIIEDAGYERTNIRANITANLKPWISIGTNTEAFVANTGINNERLGTIFGTAGGTPGMVLRAPDGRYGSVNNSEDNIEATNQLAELNSLDGSIQTRYAKTRLFLTLKPVKGLNVTGSYIYEFQDNTQAYKPVFIDRWNFLTDEIGRVASGRSYYYNRNGKGERHYNDLIATYENNNLIDKLDLTVLAGISQEQYSDPWFNARKYDLIDQELWVINAATGEAEAGGSMGDWAMQSIFGRVNLGWNSKYLLELNLRADGSSRFAKDNRWGYFPSASLGWRIIREPFMQKTSGVLSDLKLRVSYGSLGNNSIGNYAVQSTYSTGKYQNYILDNILVPGFAQITLANAKLKWETTNVSNIGLDFGFFNQRLTGEAEYFYKKTHGILIGLPIPYVHGLAGAPVQNSAEVVNKGFELNIGWKDKLAKNFSYYIRANGTWIKNEVTKYKGEEYALSGTSMIKEGYPINVQLVREIDRIVSTDEDLALVQKYIDNAPKDPNTGNARNPFPDGRPAKGDFLYKDVNNDGICDNNDRITIGTGGTPKFTYGATLGCEWKGIDFSVFIQGLVGIKTHFQNDLYMPKVRWGYHINKDIAEGRWYEGRTTPATYPRLLDFSNNKNIVASDFWVQDRSYLKIRNIHLGYTLPYSWLSKAGIDKLRIYGSFENFFTFTRFIGMDPELGGVNYPTMRHMVLGVNLTF